MASAKTPAPEVRIYYEADVGEWWRWEAAAEQLSHCPRMAKWWALTVKPNLCFSTSKKSVMSEEGTRVGSPQVSQTRC